MYIVMFGRRVVETPRENVFESTFIELINLQTYLTKTALDLYEQFLQKEAQTSGEFHGTQAALHDQAEKAFDIYLLNAVQLVMDQSLIWERGFGTPDDIFEYLKTEDGRRTKIILDRLRILHFERMGHTDIKETPSLSTTAVLLYELLTSDIPEFRPGEVDTLRSVVGHELLDKLPEGSQDERLISLKQFLEEKHPEATLIMTDSDTFSDLQISWLEGRITHVPRSRYAAYEDIPPVELNERLL